MGMWESWPQIKEIISYLVFCTPLHLFLLKWTIAIQYLVNSPKKSAAEYVQNSAAIRLTDTKNIFTIFTEIIMHIVPPPPPKKKKIRTHCFQFLIGITVVPREMEDNGCAKFLKVNKVHYGLGENGQYLTIIERGWGPRWMITPSEICILLHMTRKPNSIIVLLFIENISNFLTSLPFRRLSSKSRTVSGYKTAVLSDTPQKAYNINWAICFAYSCIPFVQLVINSTISSSDSCERLFIF